MSTVKLAPGRLAGQYCRSLIAASGDPFGASGFSAGRGYPDIVSRAAVASHNLDDADLLSVRADFMAALALVSAVDRLAAGRTVPFDTRGVMSSGGASASFVGDGQPIPLSTDPLVIGSTLARHAKVAGLSVITAELARSAAPESMILDGLVNAIAVATDAAFLDVSNEGPSASPTMGSAPASPLFGLSPAASIPAVLEAVAAGGSVLSAAAWVMSPATAAKLAVTTVSNIPAYPGMNARGGTLYGLPVITSVGSPAGQVALFDAQYLRVASDAPAIDTSRSATLQMATDPVPGAAQVTSLFNTNAIALRAVRQITWAMVGTGHAAWTTVS